MINTISHLARLNFELAVTSKRHMRNSWLTKLDDDILAGLYKKHTGQDIVPFAIDTCIVEIEPIVELPIIKQYRVGSLVLDTEGQVYRVNNISHSWVVFLKRLSDQQVITVKSSVILIPIPAFVFAEHINLGTIDTLMDLGTKHDMLVGPDGFRFTVGNLYVGDQEFARELIRYNEGR